MMSYLQFQDELHHRVWESLGWTFGKNPAFAPHPVGKPSAKALRAALEWMMVAEYDERERFPPGLREVFPLPWPGKRQIAPCSLFRLICSAPEYEVPVSIKIQMVDVLLDFGLDLNASGATGPTPMVEAVSYGESAPLVEHLFARGGTAPRDVMYAAVLGCFHLRMSARAILQLCVQRGGTLEPSASEVLRSEGLKNRHCRSSVGWKTGVTALIHAGYLFSPPIARGWRITSGGR